MNTIKLPADKRRQYTTSVRSNIKEKRAIAKLSEKAGMSESSWLLEGRRAEIRSLT